MGNMVVFPDELLLEIFVRLTHAKHVIRSSGVCKRWRTLISDRSFNYHRRSPLPYTLIHEVDYYYRLLSEALHPDTVSSYLATSRYQIDSLGTSDGLLLFKDTRERNETYLICDPLTHSCARIPHPGWGQYFMERYGLACDHRRGCFAFVILVGLGLRDCFELAVFRSDYGRWDRYCLAYPREFVARRPCRFSNGSITTENGVMHFQLLDKSGFLAFRPMSIWRDSKIGMPCGFGTADQCGHSGSLFGLVGGRLRLVQCLGVNQSYSLKIWELRYDDIKSASWVVVYDGVLGKLVGGIDLRVKALHPSTGSVVFVMHNCEAVYEYDFEQGEYSLVDSIPCEEERSYGKNIDMTTYTVVHPSWPFPILDAISTANDLLLPF